METNFLYATKLILDDPHLQQTDIILFTDLRDVFRFPSHFQRITEVYQGPLKNVQIGNFQDILKILQSLKTNIGFKADTKSLIQQPLNENLRNIRKLLSLLCQNTNKIVSSQKNTYTYTYKPHFVFNVLNILKNFVNTDIYWERLSLPENLSIWLAFG